ncbi:hypothetical protein [Kutzneria sp. NPDC051319]|uniref:hypothetical protein n=1 Tax=Kutzneria sp. NPDC051319 TaxID=3155047 RepID=UPI00342B551F
MLAIPPRYAGWLTSKGTQVEIYAHIDESGGRLPSGRRLYGIAAVLTEQSHHAALRQRLRELLMPNEDHLHFYDESPKRRLEISERLADLPFTGALLVTDETTNTEQERMRRRLLGWLLPRLQHTEAVNHAVVESRSGGDKHDRRTRDHLIKSRQVTSDMRVTHVLKHHDELLWLADFVASSYTTAVLHDQPEPWLTLNAAHAIDVITDPG